MQDASFCIIVLLKDALQIENLDSWYSVTCETLWSAREIPLVPLSADAERHTKNLFHIVVVTFICL